nr:ATP synthase F0 subunit 8 [Corythalia opima]
MPQLMPLMWVSSVCMIMFILLSMTVMYDYKEEYDLNSSLIGECLEDVSLVW